MSGLFWRGTYRIPHGDFFCAANWHWVSDAGIATTPGLPGWDTAICRPCLTVIKAFANAAFASVGSWDAACDKIPPHIRGYLSHGEPLNRKRYPVIRGRSNTATEYVLSVLWGAAKVVISPAEWRRIRRDNP